MSRHEPTREALAVGQAVADYFAAAGRSVSDVRWRDRPDLSLRLDGEIVWCETTQIPPSRIYRLVHSKFKEVEARLGINGKVDR